ncbi:hypothetical protein B0F90DRAFT_1630535 [Multifurca ochricompacta]|uniref:DUF2470 domain-containing protein n=1 Tax=Multifurca ochricompacta TaxID=376703 RepID=A0AAD4QMZ3_9AGAM|nr:hypothetical protein B0F90DRAFT_1630535 [Multifurca ochricompacta]
MTDSVADKSGFLCTYMSSHPDTLVAYAKYFGKVDGNILSAKMLSINSKDMVLEYKIKDSPNKPQVVRVEFDPPLLGYEEVKPRLLSMKADADEALGTAKAPHITHFELPSKIWITSSLLLLLIYGTYMPQNPDGKFWWLARTLRSSIFPDAFFPPTWAFVYVAHFAEGAYAATLARKHQMPWHIGAAWVGSTTIFGLPVLLRLRSLIKQARIESIMKGN